MSDWFYSIDDGKNWYGPMATQEIAYRCAGWQLVYYNGNKPLVGRRVEQTNFIMINANLGDFGYKIEGIINC